MCITYTYWISFTFSFQFTCSEPQTAANLELLLMNQGLVLDYIILFIVCIVIPNIAALV